MQLSPLDQNVPIFQQLGTGASSVILVNLFQVAGADIPALVKVLENDGNWIARTSPPQARGKVLQIRSKLGKNTVLTPFLAQIIFFFITIIRAYLMIPMRDLHDLRKEDDALDLGP